MRKFRVKLVFKFAGIDRTGSVIREAHIFLLKLKQKQLAEKVYRNTECNETMLGQRGMEKI